MKNQQVDGVEFKGKIPPDMVKGSLHDTNCFGKVEVLDYRGWCNVHYRFIDTGYSGVTRAYLIRTGSLRDPYGVAVKGKGYTGKGEYDSRDNAHKIWSSIMNRCYDEGYKLKNPTYEGCTVSDEWLNYQNFAEWYYTNYPEDDQGTRYEVDKDIKVEGNKLYSPDTCLFVTPIENKVKAHAKSYLFLSPDGIKVEIYNLRKFSRDNGLESKNMDAVHKGKRKSCKGWRRFDE